MYQNYIEYPLCKFKKGDNVYDENDNSNIYTITSINKKSVMTDCNGRIYEFSLQYVNDHFSKIKN